jgi:hypothetical protein
MLSKLKLFALVVVLCISTLPLAWFIHYQVRLRLLVTEPLIVRFSHGSWVECLANPELIGHIHSVKLTGIVVVDTSGSFTNTNLSTPHNNEQQICHFLGISVVDAKAKRYFVQFRFVQALLQAGNERSLWRNPFST